MLIPSVKTIKNQVEFWVKEIRKLCYKFWSETFWLFQMIFKHMSLGQAISWHWGHSIVISMLPQLLEDFRLLLTTVSARSACARQLPQGVTMWISSWASSGTSPGFHGFIFMAATKSACFCVSLCNPECKSKGSGLYATRPVWKERLNLSRAADIPGCIFRQRKVSLYLPTTWD